MINLEKEIREQPETLKRAAEINLPVIRDIVKEAKEKKIHHIYFAARGTSDHACIYAQYLFGIFAGIPCTLGTPSVFTKYGAHVDLSDMLVIGVSQSGKAEDVLAVIESAKKDGAVTVALTNNENSPLAENAKYHLFCGCGHEASIAATKTFTSQMMILGTLCAVWAGNDALLDELQKAHLAVDSLLNRHSDEIRNLAKKCAAIDGAVILGRGISYCIALEGALKMLETNKIKMKGYPISDFHHGPIAQLKKGDVVFVLSPEGKSEDDSEEICRKLHGVGADIIFVTDKASIAPENTTVVELPATGSEFTFPYTAAVFFQYLACCMCLEKGIDPDLAGVINKITITK